MSRKVARLSTKFNLKKTSESRLKYTFDTFVPFFLFFWIVKTFRCSCYMQYDNDERLSHISHFSIPVLSCYIGFSRNGFYRIQQIFDRQVSRRSNLCPNQTRAQCCLLRSKSFPSMEPYNGTMAEREKGLISSRRILIYAVNLIRQRGRFV